MPVSQPLSALALAGRHAPPPPPPHPHGSLHPSAVALGELGMSIAAAAAARRTVHDPSNAPTLTPKGCTAGTNPFDTRFTQILNASNRAAPKAPPQAWGGLGAPKNSAEAGGLRALGAAAAAAAVSKPRAPVSQGAGKVSKRGRYCAGCGRYCADETVPCTACGWLYAAPELRPTAPAPAPTPAPAPAPAPAVHCSSDRPELEYL